MGRERGVGLDPPFGVSFRSNGDEPMNAAFDRVPQIESVFTRMAKLLDLKLGSETDAVRLIANGISPRAYKRVADKLKFPPALVAPESTVRRRLASNSRFTEAESERVVRLARVFAEAVQLFEDEATALAWLNAPSEYLPGQPPITPMALAASDAGARLIESHIRRTAHGMF
jgi:putative toxin-antitoxin system antitoxin component (TIGR02293 family)